MRPFSLNIRNEVREYEHPCVMGILNVTPDSFYQASRATAEDDIKRKVEAMLSEGADFIDIGAYSTRPGCSKVSEHEEISRLELGMRALRSVAADAIVSVDTFRSPVARMAVNDLGCDMVNDISGGAIDAQMMECVAMLKVPYVITHMRGTPANKNDYAAYDSVVAETLHETAERVSKACLLGIDDIIIDPGFGFSKTLDQNYELLKQLRLFEKLGMPILVGISRKSMVKNLLGIDAEDALPGTIALTMTALEQGASIIRAHDVRATRQAIDIYCKLQNTKPYD